MAQVGVSCRIKAANGTSEYVYGRNNCWVLCSDSPGSIGCIDLSSFMDRFLDRLGRTPAGPIVLNVRYGVSPDGLEPSNVDRYGTDISSIA